MTTETKRVFAPEKMPTQWTCTHFGGISEIEAFVEASGSWETVAEIRAAAGLDAEDLADFIVQALIGHVADRSA